MKCPFCECPIKTHDMYDKACDWLKVAKPRWTYYQCNEENCWDNGEFPRYMAMRDHNNNLISEEYIIGNFYVKVYPTGTLIYKNVGGLLVDEVKVPTPIWLNVINIEATLDRLKMCVIFS